MLRTRPASGRNQHMTPESLLDAVVDIDVMLHLLGSLISGATIGAERQFQRARYGPNATRDPDRDRLSWRWCDLSRGRHRARSDDCSVAVAHGGTGHRLRNRTWELAAIGTAITLVAITPLEILEVELRGQLEIPTNSRTAVSLTVAMSERNRAAADCLIVPRLRAIVQGVAWCREKQMAGSGIRC